MGLTREQLKQKAFREKENKRKREWRLRKKLEHSRSERRWERKKEKLRQQLAEMTDEPPGEYKHPVTIEETRQQLEDDGKKFIQIQSHFKGKKPLQFADTKTSAPVSANPKRRLHWRAKPTPQKLFAAAIPEAQAPHTHSTVQSPDITEEQLENPMTTIWCPESIKEEGMADVRRHPELYIEINVVKKSRVVDTFYIDAERKTFLYKKKECKLKEDAIYLLPTKLGAFMPTTYYKEGDPDPKGFKQTNKGITGKALSLLYMEQLYTSLLYSEDVKYNFFIVILSIAILIAYGIGCYFLFSGAWMVKPTPAGGGVPITTILLPWLGRF